eukprot:gene6293-biopygen8106
MDQLLCHTSDVVAAGTTARSWGLGSKPGRPQQQQFTRQLQHLTAALATSEGPFLTGQKLCLLQQSKDSKEQPRAAIVATLYELEPTG